MRAGGGSRNRPDLPIFTEMFAVSTVSSPVVGALVPVVCGILGLLVGSFLNVVIHRVPLRQSVVTPRSRCTGCGTQLADRDNIPVVSWVLLRGRCRTCG